MRVGKVENALTGAVAHPGRNLRDIYNRRLTYMIIQIFRNEDLVFRSYVGCPAEAYAKKK